MYRVWCDFAKERQRPCHIRDNLSRKYFRFHHCSTNVVLFSNSFLRTLKLLHRTLNWNVRKDYNFLDFNLQRNLFFDSNRVLGIAQRAFNFKYKIVLRCGRTTCSEKNFSCRAIEACMFSNVVYVHGHETFCRVVRSKTVFSEMNSERNNFLRNKLYLIMLNV